MNTMNMSGFSESVYKGNQHNAKADEAMRNGITIKTRVNG